MVCDHTSQRRNTLQKYQSFRDIPQFTREGGYAVDYPIHSLVKWIFTQVNEESLNLCPDFQRGHVWTEKQQIRYLEFLLRGGKTGRDLYFNCPSWQAPVACGEYNDFVCVDGLQRITAITRFVNNELPVFGSYFSEYEDKRWLTIHSTVRVHVNDLKTRREVINWYLEMNTGGTPHTDAEIERVRALLEQEDET